MPWIIIGIIISYFLGSIPTAYIFGRLTKGIDIRNYGSGNVGATNAARVLGKKLGALILFLDMLKGFISAGLGGNILARYTPQLSIDKICIILGIACISGHIWTIFLRFKGGKGVATTLGVLLGLGYNIPDLMVIFLLMVLIWFLIFAISRYVSLASVIAAITLPFFMIIFKQTKILLGSSILISILIILSHRANIQRLIQGTEPKLITKRQQT